MEGEVTSQTMWIMVCLANLCGWVYTIYRNDRILSVSYGIGSFLSLCMVVNLAHAQPTFPDFSDQKKELFSSKDVKVVERKGYIELWDGDYIVSSSGHEGGYLLLTDYLKDKKVFEVGLGLGMFANLCLENGCTLTSVEILKDAITYYESNNSPNPRLTIIQNDIFEEIKTHKGKYDVILYDLFWYMSQENYDQMKVFLAWAKNNLSKNGIVILNANQRNEDALIAEKSDFSFEKLMYPEKGMARRSHYLILKVVR